MPSPRENVNYHFWRDHCEPTLGRTLVVGSKIYGRKPDRRLLYQDSIGLDMEDGDGVDVVWDLENDPENRFGTFTHIDCASVLEHVRRPWLFAQNCERLLEPGGSIFILVPWVWRVHSYPSDYWRMTAAAVRSLFPGIKWKRFMYSTDRELAKKPPAVTIEESVYFPRCELLGVGSKSKKG